MEGGEDLVGSAVEEGICEESQKFENSHFPNV